MYSLVLARGLFLKRFPSLVKILPNRTYVDGSKHRVADVAVGDKEDGLDEAEEEELERVDLPDENAKGDENCGGTETSFQHSTISNCERQEGL